MCDLRFGVTVRVELLHANEMRFPAVTVCNMSPVRKSAAVRMAQQKQAAAEQVQARKKKRKRKKRASKFSNGWLVEEWYVNKDLFGLSLTNGGCSTRQVTLTQEQCRQTDRHNLSTRFYPRVTTNDRNWPTSHCVNATNVNMIAQTRQLLRKGRTHIDKQYVELAARPQALHVGFASSHVPTQYVQTFAYLC